MKKKTYIIGSKHEDVDGVDGAILYDKDGNKLAVLNKFKVYEEEDIWEYAPIYDIGNCKFMRPDIKDFKFESKDVKLCEELSVGYDKMKISCDYRIEYKYYICYGCWMERIDWDFSDKPLAFHEQLLHKKDFQRYLCTMTGWIMKIDKKQECVEYSLNVED